jgi:hypothetical protein
MLSVEVECPLSYPPLEAGPRDRAGAVTIP